MDSEEGAPRCEKTMVPTASISTTVRFTSHPFARYSFAIR